MDKVTSLKTIQLVDNWAHPLYLRYLHSTPTAGTQGVFMIKVQHHSITVAVWPIPRPMLRLLHGTPVRVTSTWTHLQLYSATQLFSLHSNNYYLNVHCMVDSDTEDSIAMWWGIAQW